MEQRADRISLLDINGKAIRDKNTAGEGTEKIDIHDLASGIYLLQIMANGELYNTKFVKE